MSRQQLEALGYTFVESDLPPIVRDWCIGDSVLCLIGGEFDYFDGECWKKLKPFKIDRVLAGYWIFAGLVVVEPAVVWDVIQATDQRRFRMLGFKNQQPS